MPGATGHADLPLHRGHVPAWLAERMATLGRAIAEAVVLEFGRETLLDRLANPFWFQSFGAVLGMDWHSSGITTSVLGALKRGLEPVADELGLYVCGGRGRHSRRTPQELIAVGERTGLDGDQLARTSRLVAKVDSAALQDGFDLYLHAFIVAGDGRWVVVQQGMSGPRGVARRYHWHSDAISTAGHPGAGAFVDAPHRGIDGVDPRRAGAPIANLTDRSAAPSRDAQIELVRQGPDRIIDVARRLAGAPDLPTLPHLEMPARHALLAGDVRLRRLHASLAAAADRGPVDYPALLLQPGVGARTVLTLSMVAEVIYGAPYLFEDPGRYSLALGGKDGHPFPVPLEVYDRTIEVLRGAVRRARLGRREQLAAMRRLDRQARRVEAWLEAHPQSAAGPSYEAFVAAERRASAQFGGRRVGRSRPGRQLPLF